MIIGIYLMGGLGNQLFQIYSLISYSIKHKIPFRLENKSLLIGNTIRNTYWDTLLINLKPFLIKNVQNNSIIIREKSFNYDDNIDNEIELIKSSIISISSTELENNKKNILLYGYYQSYKYIDKYFDIINKLLKIEEQKISLLKKVKIDSNETTISLHLRIGDYKNIVDYHPIMPYEYYAKALSVILDLINLNNGNNYSNIKVIIFYEDKDIDDVNIILNKLRENFTHIVFKYREDNLKDYEELLYMSLCKHNIIANSSFSWWGAYYNNNPNKIVCFPHIWFGNSFYLNNKNSNTNDLCPENWKKIVF